MEFGCLLSYSCNINLKMFDVINENTGRYWAPWHPGESTSKRKKSDSSVTYCSYLRLWMRFWNPWTRVCERGTNASALVRNACVCALDQIPSALDPAKMGFCLSGSRREEMILLPSAVEEVITSPYLQDWLFLFRSASMTIAKPSTSGSLQHKLCPTLRSQGTGECPLVLSSVDSPICEHRVENDSSLFLQWSISRAWKASSCHYLLDLLWRDSNWPWIYYRAFC